MEQANIAKAAAAIDEAEKALTKTSIFAMFVSSTKKYEEAAEAYNRAGNFYKLANDFQKAGAAYKRASENFAQAGDCKTEVVNATVEAATCYKKANDIVRSIKLFEKAIEHYNDNGRLGMSARYQKEIAEMYEADNNYPLAVEKYKRAAELFNHDNKRSNANQCLQKAATFLSESGDSAQMAEAAQIFESIARESLTSRLGAFSAKGYFFQSLLIYLALGDPIKVNNKVEQYGGEDHTFASSRECDFIVKLSKVRSSIRWLHSRKRAFFLTMNFFNLILGCRGIQRRRLRDGVRQFRSHHSVGSLEDQVVVARKATHSRCHRSGRCWR
jgi:alpha-soluble NSF attachment protein